MKKFMTKSEKQIRKSLIQNAKEFTQKLQKDHLTLKDYIKIEQNYISLVEFPETLSTQIKEITTRSPFTQKQLKQSIQDLSASINDNKFKAIEYGPLESVSSLAYMHLHYAPLHNIFKQLLRVRNFSPTSLFDYGSGYGTSTYTALKFYPSLKHGVAVDKSEHMLEILKKIIPKSYPEFEIDTKVQNRPSSSLKFDLVISSFLLSDLKDDYEREVVVGKLFEITNDMLILVDRGSPLHSSLIMKARQKIIDLSASEPDFSIIAPVYC